MANEQNLVPQNKRTKSEQRKIASLGGKKSRCFKAKEAFYQGNYGRTSFNGFARVQIKRGNAKFWT